ncbi:UNVERIFIED_CONTAM: Copia protein [Sesamum latifolium]|uniref:Copia protein n=1 Tax=Sesamum latifolium TaxID=2727402 RepID=A0AAW2TD72_9LAMI
MGSTVCELLWISYLLRDFHISIQRPIPFWCDNRAGLHITANPVFHECTKHLDIDCHLVRDQFKLGFISPSYIPGKDQVADLFTKSLPAPYFTRLLVKLGMVPPAPPCGGAVEQQETADLLAVKKQSIADEEVAELLEVLKTWVRFY